MKRKEVLSVEYDDDPPPPPPKRPHLIDLDPEEDPPSSSSGGTSSPPPPSTPSPQKRMLPRTLQRASSTEQGDHSVLHNLSERFSYSPRKKGEEQGGDSRPKDEGAPSFSTPAATSAASSSSATTASPSPPIKRSPTASETVPLTAYFQPASAAPSAPLAHELAPEQKKVLDLVALGKNVFFTGCAGTGKSFLLSHIIQNSHKGTTFVTATTGIAALHIGGTTIHKFAGIGLGDRPKEKLLETVRKSKNRKNWAQARRLIIDEVSMLSVDLLEKLDFIARRIRMNLSKPFGGIQVIMSGDFFQLPPVTKGGRASLCFQSSLWGELFGPENMVELTKVFRQSEGDFIRFLQEVRFSSLSAESMQLISRLQRPLNIADDIIPTKLYSTNLDVDAMNQRFLQELPGEEVLFKARDFPPNVDEMLDRAFLAQRNLVLKPKAQVMLIKNLDHKHVNGSRGIIVRFDREVEQLPGGETVERTIPVVRFLNGEVRKIPVAEWTTGGSGSSSAKRVQVPLKLAWAVTVHKSQGLTIDYLEVDLRGAFEFGQAYVALSRARRLEGLRILALDPSKIRSHPAVVSFYRGLSASTGTAPETPSASPPPPAATTPLPSSPPSAPPTPATTTSPTPTPITIPTPTPAPTTPTLSGPSAAPPHCQPEEEPRSDSEAEELAELDRLLEQGGFSEVLEDFESLPREDELEAVEDQGREEQEREREGEGEASPSPPPPAPEEEEEEEKEVAPPPAPEANASPSKARARALSILASKGERKPFPVLRRSEPLGGFVKASTLMEGSPTKRLA